MSEPKTVTIPATEYADLLADKRMLGALRAGGVDNWDGWDFAIESLTDEDEQ